MTILVIGGTGKVGGTLVENLVAAGAPVRVLSRDLARAAAIPGIDPVAADLTGDVDAAAVAFAGIDTVFMLNRPSLGEMPEGVLAVALAQQAGVRRFVYQSVHNADRMDYIPHVASKLAIERAVLASGMAWTFLCPNYFFQNDLTARSAIEQGRFTAPIGDIGVASVDAGDIADAALACLIGEGHEGKRYNLVGPEILTGERCAATWSDVLKREVKYEGDVDAWRDSMRPFLPAWFSYDLAMMYRHLARHGMPPNPGDVAALTQLLGRPPRPYRAYVEAQAAQWGMLG